MIRGALVTFDSILGGAGLSRLNRMSGGWAAGRLAVRRISTKPAQVTNLWRHVLCAPEASRLWTRQRATLRRPMRTGPIRSPFGSVKRPFHSSKARQSSEGASKASQSQSVSARLKQLSKEYGWTVVAVYLGLSVLDFPFCFLLVRLVGTERIGAAEEWVVSYVKKAIPEAVKTWWHEYREATKKATRDVLGDEAVSKGLEPAGWSVEEADARNKHEPSLATQLALAYAIHKSFIFFRVPLAAAVTPKVVRLLRSWGWQIGKKRP